MITMTRKTFEKLCAALGVPLSKAEAAVVSSSQGTVVVDERRADYPKKKGCGCRGVKNVS